MRPLQGMLFLIVIGYWLIYYSLSPFYYFHHSAMMHLNCNLVHTCPMMINSQQRGFTCFDHIIEVMYPHEIPTHEV